jgi:hypothetical protein
MRSIRPTLLTLALLVSDPGRGGRRRHPRVGRTAVLTYPAGATFSVTQIRVR